MSVSQNQAIKMNDFVKGINMGLNTFKLLLERANTNQLKNTLENTIKHMTLLKQKITKKVEEAGVVVANKLPMFGKIISFFEDYKYSRAKNDFFLTLEGIKALNMGIEKANIFYHSKKEEVSYYHENIDEILECYDDTLVKLKDDLKKFNKSAE